MNERLGDVATCYRLTLERQSKHSASRVWAAITDPGQVSAWMGYPARVDLRIGGEWHVNFAPAHDGRIDGVIVRLDPGRAISYAFDLLVVEWTLEDTPTGCRYTFVQNGLADPGGLEVGLAGWHGFIANIEPYLDGEAVDHADSPPGWDELLRRYRARIDAAGQSVGSHH